MFSTSYNEEFKWPEATGWGIKKWPKDRNLELESVKVDDPVYRNNETLFQLSADCLTPFDFLLRPKPIVQTDPHQPFNKPELPKDDGSARLTRPRVYKCPEISLDDIDDPEVRGKVIDFTYSTTWGIASKDACGDMVKQEVPNTVLEPPDHVLFNNKSKENEECEEVSNKVLSDWDKHQSRAHVDSTSAFWQQYTTETSLKPPIKAVTDIIKPEFTEKILDLAERKKLRLPYDLKPSGYTGTMPESPMKIPPQKKELPFHDPMITSYQIANRWLDH